jgi:hypothetical protein
VAAAEKALDDARDELETLRARVKKAGGGGGGATGRDGEDVGAAAAADGEGEGEAASASTSAEPFDVEAEDAYQARSIHWFPYDRVGVVNAVP